MRSAKAGLQGLFAVYKPPGVYWKQVRDAVETNLLKDLNKFRRPAPRKHIYFLPSTVEGADGKELTITATEQSSLVDHPLVSGPLFTHWKMGVGHRLDKKSSGVFVLAAGKGTKKLVDCHSAHFTRTYTVRGLFGKATDDFSDTGKLIEKTTFEHITREQLERVLSVIQGSNHKALLQLSAPLYFLPRRHYCPPQEHKDREESQPLSYLKSPAKKWTVAQSMGSDHEQPVWRGVLIGIICMAFVLWCMFRSPTELDQKLEELLMGKELEDFPPKQEKP
nr:probable tRNA pseudouridine synthase 2 isoform X2 [Pogona vitticeps]